MSVGEGIPGVPSATTAERALLGSVLLFPEFLLALELVPDDFFIPSHRIIFEAMLRVLGTNQPPDMILVHHDLARTGQLERVGGLAELSRLTDMAHMSPFLCGHYAELIHRTAVDRRIISVGSRLAAIGYEGEGLEKALREARAEIDQLGGRPKRRVLPE